MATELFFTPIPNLPRPFVKFPENPLRIPLFALPPLTISSGFCSLKTVSSSRGRSSSAVHAVQEEVIQAPNSDSQTAPPSSSKLVLVVGGTGGVESVSLLEDIDPGHNTGISVAFPLMNDIVQTFGSTDEELDPGQLIVASLLSRNIKARLLLRDPEKATTLFGKQDEEKLQVCKGDTRNPEDVDPSIFEGVTHVICCTGTTAFPSKRWDGDNTPERVDWEGVRNLVSALPSSLKRIVLVSSVGVTKFNEIPWSIMNLFGVLKYKKMGEDFLRNSGLPFTIIRPGRLTDGPYTSYDLNTLLKATAGQRRAVLIGKGKPFIILANGVNLSAVLNLEYNLKKNRTQFWSANSVMEGDKLIGEVSRLVVAEACIQALDIDFTEGEIYEINSVEGEGPGKDPQKWRELFKAAGAQ
ncbi:hypothetical protein Pint_30897 [Pistacia integerrima]|uniref:Uncharacterized protein n=1 Tax=Pistacia integerrima TaxID=434235 RepID=A0ACC0XPR3_9ROSI|nr:hypothetical protein Pint_30897 [Pistacia integerrima]